MQMRGYWKRRRTRVVEAGGIRSTSVSPALLDALWQRFLTFARSDWRAWTGKSTFGYLFGAITTVYGLLDLVLDLNISVPRLARVPAIEFYREEIVPFLSQPVRWTGLGVSPWYESLLALAGVGAAIWTTAEFRQHYYLALYPFPRWQKRPGWLDLDQDYSVPPTPRVESRRSYAVRWLVKIPESLFLTYSLIGLPAVVLGLGAGIGKVAAAVGDWFVFSGAQLLYVCQWFLEPYEDWNDQDARGTRIFLKVYNARRKLDDRLSERRSGIHVIPLRRPLRELVREILLDASHVAAFAIAIMLVGWFLLGL